MEKRQESNNPPYWLVRAAIELAASTPCKGCVDLEYGYKCPASGNCITDWCTSCAANAWIESKATAAPTAASPKE